MKKLLFLLFIISGLFTSCVEQEKYPSTLDGLRIEDQTFSSAALKTVINVNTTLTDVMVTVIDTKTTYPANWLDVDINGKTITLTLMENITINDRTACVTLRDKGRDDVQDDVEPVVFYVTQKKNSLFEGMDVEEVVMDYQQGDTTLTFKSALKNIKAEVADLEGGKVDWLKTAIDGKDLTINVSLYTSKEDRVALVKLVPNSDQYVSDSLLSHTTFLVRQQHNPVLDSLTIDPIISLCAGGHYVVHVDRPLTGVRAQVVDDATNQRASWCTATVGGDSVSVTTTIHNLQKDRTATVTLYYPNHGDVIDSTTISLPFVVKQRHNGIFDGAHLSNRSLSWNQTADTLKLTTELKDIRCQLVDTLTKKTPTWIQATVEGNKVVFKSSTLTSTANRTTLVTLYMVGKDNTLTEETVQTSFYVTQHHDNIFDGVLYHDRIVTWDEKNDTLKLDRELIDIKCQLVDKDTKQTPTWLQATVKGKNVEFVIKDNLSKAERSATVTLYLPNGNTIDEKTVKTSFSFKQSGNNIFSGRAFPDLGIRWNQATQSIKTEVDLSIIRSKLVDDATKRAPDWLQVSFDTDNKEIVVRASQLSSIDDRSATVTLYVPNNGSTIDENTEQTSFKVTQHHYAIFDGVRYHDRSVNWDTKYDTLKTTAELENIRCQLIDVETQKSPSWLQATVNGKNVEFVTQTNYSKYERSANVTLYLPNGNTIDSKTIHTDFTFTQKGNNFLDSLSVANHGVEWNVTNDEIKTNVDLSSVRYKVVDEATAQAPLWLSLSLEGNIIKLRPSKLTTIYDRSAMVTLYVGSNLNEDTPQKSFRVTQHHDNIFDGVTLKDRILAFDQKEDVLTLSRTLTDIGCQIIDDETQMSARWISATINENKVTFTVQTNTSLATRSATVTLYLPNGNTIDENSVKTSFKVEQEFQKKLEPSVNKVEVNYENQKKELTITSNVKYQIKSPEWVTCVMTPESETTEKLSLTFDENTTNQVREDTLRFSVGGEEMAKVALKQRTNPKITINFPDNRKKLTFPKDGGVINLPVKTLTPGYHITRTGTWISVGQTTVDDYDQYYNQITVPVFTGSNFERTDSIIISNTEERIAFPVYQHKLVYVNTASAEVEEGNSITLSADCKPGYSITWKTSNAGIATVSQGQVTGVKRGSVKIYASIGSVTVDGTVIKDYNDYCDVKVYDVTDKVNVRRGTGQYENIGGNVTSNCPVIITNNYHSSVTLSSFEIVDGENNLVTGAQNDLPITLPKGESVTIDLAKKLVAVPNAKVRVVVNGKTKDLVAY